MLVPNGDQHTAEFLIAVERCACASTHHPFLFSQTATHPTVIPHPRVPFKTSTPPLCSTFPAPCHMSPQKLPTPLTQPAAYIPVHHPALEPKGNTPFSQPAPLGEINSTKTQPLPHNQPTAPKTKAPRPRCRDQKTTPHTRPILPTRPAANVPCQCYGPLSPKPVPAQRGVTLPEETPPRNCFFCGRDATLQPLAEETPPCNCLRQPRRHPATAFKTDTNV